MSDLISHLVKNNINHTISDHGDLTIETWDGLNLSGTSITTLPDNLTVNGDLDLRDTTITVLPNHLTMIDDLYL